MVGAASSEDQYPKQVPDLRQLINDRPACRPRSEYETNTCCATGVNVLSVSSTQSNMHTYFVSKSQEEIVCASACIVTKQDDPKSLQPQLFMCVSTRCPWYKHSQRMRTHMCIPATCMQAHICAQLCFAQLGACVTVGTPFQAENSRRRPLLLLPRQVVDKQCVDPA